MEEAPHSRDKALKFFKEYTRENQKSLSGKTVVDLSAGSGFIAHLFEQVNGFVTPYDLYPENCRSTIASCKFINLQEAFPIPDSSVDLAILAETIEHLPNQFFLFKEVGRILKPGGILLFTTPNSSSLRSRFSQFIGESEHYSNPSPDEISALVKWDSGKEYFGKLFVSGVLRLRALAALNQLRIKKIYPSSRSSTSYFLLIFYPIILFFSGKMKSRQTRKDPDHRDIYNEIFRINTSSNILLSKHLLMEFERVA